MSILEGIPIIGKLFNTGAEIVKEYVTDKDKQIELLHTLNMTKIDAENKLLEAQVSIVKAEATGNWLQRSWRPLCMCVIILIIANNYLVYPYLHALTNKVVMLELPDRLWTVFEIGLGGYVVGR